MKNNWKLFIVVSIGYIIFYYIIWRLLLLRLCLPSPGDIIISPVYYMATITELYKIFWYVYCSSVLLSIIGWFIYLKPYKKDDYEK
jgi:hypothetical protein